ncbi:MAG: acyl-CoA dehydrogenase family protein [Chloroflexota bacterium]|nr:acyl-CoA dehydrogenase family protein [Chloroflexota bacterium]
MNFSWTEEQDRLYATTLQATQEKLNDPEGASHTYWSLEQWHLCAELGLLGLCVPESYGGSGYGALTTARVVEAFGRGCQDMGLLFSAAAHLFACSMPIAEYGSEAIKQALLPKMCSGEIIAANAITEDGAGSDVFALKTRAVRDGDDYILTGTKSYVSNGPVADLYVIYALTKPEHGYLGITGFVVERDTPGLSAGEPFSKLGMSSTPACAIVLHECRVPAANRLGREGQGSFVFTASMQWERACLFAGYLGQMEQQLELASVFARERRQFGKALSKNQAIAHRLVDMKLQLEAARLLLYRACWLLEQGEDATLAISLSKLAVSEAAIQVGLDTLHILGSAGFKQDASVSKMLMNAIPGTIFSGTSEMQRNIIARELAL